MKAYTHFTLEERECLAKYLALGWSNGKIAKKLGRHRSTVGREIKRNSSLSSNTKGEYLPLTAARKYVRRRKRCVRKPRLLADEALLAYTKNCLSKYWSPETIVTTYKLSNKDVKLSHSTIYRALEKKEIKGYCGFIHLRRRNKQKYVRKDSATIKPEHTIHDRPVAANARERIGDWEGDTVLGGKHKGALIVMADRKSRYYTAALIPNLKSKVVEAHMCRLMSSLPISTITLDNGSEFAKHKTIAKNLNTTIYFTEPHSPWQKGTVENLNDVMRFFYPKGYDFTSLTEQQLNETLELINTRPRKCLGWRTPKEVFFEGVLQLG